ncbi:MAG: DNA polymerase III subunit gamma/tau [Candidatus Buchananbacteria bacterium]
MSLALYRKYRPKTFGEVIGQNHIKTTLESELQSNKIAHAFLFSGPRGLGKTTTARLLAKAVNCLKRKEGESEPCNVCDACLEINEGRSIDVIEIDAASNTGVDNVRENIISNSRFTPTSRKFKVFIIDEVHMLSISAFNALLKTLEEPPAHAIFILATTEIHKVPETIISRCQHFEFHKVSESEIIGRLNHLITLENKKVDKEVVENIAYICGGCLRDAESLLGQILSLDDKRITLEQAELVLPRSRFDLALELVNFLNRKDTAAAILLVNNLIEDGVELEKFTGDLIEIVRKIMLVKINKDLSGFAGALSKDLEKRLIEISEKTSLEFLINSLDILMKKKQEMKYSDIIQLPLELAIIEITVENNNSKIDPPKPPNLSGSGSGASVGDEIKPKEVKSAPMPTMKSEEAIMPPVAVKSDEAALGPRSGLGKKIDFEQIKEKWGDFLVCLKKYNASLAAAMKICLPVKIDDNGALEVCFNCKFHQQRLNDTKNRQIVERALAEIFGAGILVKATVDENMVNDFKPIISSPTESPASEGDLGSVLQAFGGQLIE